MLSHLVAFVVFCQHHGGLGDVVLAYNCYATSATVEQKGIGADTETEQLILQIRILRPGREMAPLRFISPDLSGALTVRENDCLWGHCALPLKRRGEALQGPLGLALYRLWGSRPQGASSRTPHLCTEAGRPSPARPRHGLLSQPWATVAPAPQVSPVSPELQIHLSFSKCAHGPRAPRARGLLGATHNAPAIL